MTPVRSVLALALVLALASCNRGAEEPVLEEAPQEEAPPEAPKPKGFDIATVPVSDAPVGEFPYFTMPPGYHVDPKLSSTIEDGVFPFRAGDQYVGVRGRIYQANFRADAGRTFSTLEVDAYVDRQLEQAGAKKVFEGVIPREDSGEVLTRELTRTYANGLCWPKEPVRTWVLHRTDRAIWVHACSYGGIGSAWVIAEAEQVAPAETDAVGSEQLKQKIDADGRVGLSIQFESDSARMLSGSQQQIAEILELMESQPELVLSVNGYTDDSGTAERNQALSQSRAEAIRDALVERGVAANRLRAKGFGRERPVASNADADGRAQNRRVELERI